MGRGLPLESCKLGYTPEASEGPFCTPFFFTSPWIFTKQIARDKREKRSRGRIQSGEQDLIGSCYTVQRDRERERDVEDTMMTLSKMIGWTHDDSL